MTVLVTPSLRLGQRVLAMPLDLVLRQAHVAGQNKISRDIGVSDGRIVAIEPHIDAEAQEIKLDGRLVVAVISSSSL